MRYTVVEKGETSYGAYVPDLPGSVAVAESLEEVRNTNIKILLPLTIKVQIQLRSCTRSLSIEGDISNDC